MAEQAQTPNTEPAFNIERIYLKDLSVENPQAPQVFASQTEAPNMEVALNTAAVKVQEDFYDVTVTLNVTAKSGDQTLFLVEAKEAGVFLIRGVPDGELGQVLGVHCPNIIFPFAREVVSDAINRMGFPPVYLAPINFEALYQQQLQNEMQKMEQTPSGVTIQ